MGPFGRNLFSGRPCLFCFSNNLSHHRNLFSSSNKNHTETKLNEPFSLLFVNPTQRLTSNMPASGVKVTDECIDSYEAMKQKRKYKYCIYKLSDNMKEIVMTKCSTIQDVKTDPQPKATTHLSGI